MSLGSSYPPMGMFGAQPGLVPPSPQPGRAAAPKGKRSSPDKQRREILKRVESEIKKGYPNEKRARLDAARVNDDFYSGRFDAYVASWDIDRDAIRTSRIMSRVTEILSGLYKDGPQRSITDAPDVAAAVDQIYRDNAMDALWQAADSYAIVNQVAAFEVQGNIGEDSADRPLEIVLWTADSFMVWLDPDNPRSVLACATIDLYDEQRRVKLWTPEERVTYVSARQAPAQTSGGVSLEEQERVPNPYGVLPFSFVHFRYPATYFWQGSPGDNLRQLNAHINYRLSKMADDVLHSRPIGVITGARTDWNFGRDHKAGTWQSIPSEHIDAGGTSSTPTASYITCDMGYLAQDWEDLKGYLAHTLQMNGVPEAAIRLEQSGAMSGVAILSEQIPVVQWTEARQQPFAHYERSLLKTVCTVAAAHARNNDLPTVLDVPVEQWEAVAARPDQRLKWKPQLGPMLALQRKDYDEFRLNNYLVSRTQLHIEAGMDREEAEAYVVETMDDVAREQELVNAIPSAPTPAGPPTPDGAEPPAEGAEGEPGAEPTEEPTDGGRDDSEPEPETPEEG